MSGSIEKQFLRLFMFAHKVCTHVVRDFIESNILSERKYSDDLLKFLEHHQHEIYHLMEITNCCKCGASNDRIEKRSRMNMEQFKQLYAITVGNSDPKHLKKNKAGKIIQYCLCGISVNTSCSLDDIDITLLYCIIHNCVNLQSDEKMWLDTIRKQRNTLCHVSEISQLKENHIKTIWQYLEGSVLGLASKIQPLRRYEKMVKREIEMMNDTEYDMAKVQPIIDVMKSEFQPMIESIESFKEEILKGLNGLIHEQESAKDWMSHLGNMRKEEHDHLSAQVVKCHTENSTQLKDLENELVKHTRTVIDTTTKGQSTLLKEIENTVITEVQKGTKKLSHQIDQVRFKVEAIRPPSLPTQKEDIQTQTGQLQAVGYALSNTASEKEGQQVCVLRWTIDTPGFLENEKKKIIDIVNKSAEAANVFAPYKLQFAYDGSVTINTLLPVDVLNNNELFEESIRHFLNQLVTICQIDTSRELTVHVNIEVIPTDKKEFSIEDKRQMNDVAIQTENKTVCVDKDVQVDNDAVVEFSIEDKRQMNDVAIQTENKTVDKDVQVDNDAVFYTGRKQMNDVAIQTENKSVFVDKDFKIDTDAVFYTGRKQMDDAAIKTENKGVFVGKDLKIDTDAVFYTGRKQMDDAAIKTENKGVFVGKDLKIDTDAVFYTGRKQMDDVAIKTENKGVFVGKDLKIDTDAVFYTGRKQMDDVAIKTENKGVFFGKDLKIDTDGRKQMDEVAIKTENKGVFVDKDLKIDTDAVFYTGRKQMDDVAIKTENKGVFFGKDLKIDTDAVFYTGRKQMDDVAIKTENKGVFFGKDLKIDTDGRKQMDEVAIKTENKGVFVDKDLKIDTDAVFYTGRKQMDDAAIKTENKGVFVGKDLKIDTDGRKQMDEVAIKTENKGVFVDKDLKIDTDGRKQMDEVAIKTENKGVFVDKDLKIDTDAVFYTGRKQMDDVAIKTENKGVFVGKDLKIDTDAVFYTGRKQMDDVAIKTENKGVFFGKDLKIDTDAVFYTGRKQMDDVAIKTENKGVFFGKDLKIDTDGRKQMDEIAIKTENKGVFVDKDLKIDTDGRKQMDEVAIKTENKGVFVDKDLKIDTDGRKQMDEVAIKTENKGVFVDKDLKIDTDEMECEPKPKQILKRTARVDLDLEWKQKRMKFDDLDQEWTKKTATITGPEPSTSSKSGSVVVTEDSKTQENLYIHSEFVREAKDQNAAYTKMETDSQLDQANILEHEKNLVGKSDTSSITLRDYQQELAELALRGENTIICAGTNSGKTYIALHIIEKHLNENTNGTIAFLTRTNVLLEQQFQLACKLLPRLTRNGKIRKWQAGQDVTSETFKNWVKTSSIIFVTPQSMCNFLEEELENSRVEMNQFTLLVLDECHHTYGKAPYNGIMRHYRKLKYGEKPTPRPQILGLTASPGTNRAKDVVSAKEHLKLIMANLDVSKLSVVQKYKSSLLEHSSIPEKVCIQSTKRQKDPVKDLLLQAMDDVEDVLNCRLVITFLRNPVNKTDTILNALCNPPKDRTTVRYLQWLAETRMKVEEISASQSTIPRLLHACLRHLEFYAECLEINALLDISNVRDAIKEGYIRLKEESEKAIETKEKDLVKKSEDVYSNIFELGRRIEGNPDIENVIQTLEKEYDELTDESRFLVFVKTRLTAKALAEKMPEHFKSRYLTGSQTSKEEGGLSREEQADIVARFREGKHLCVVATSVAAEGLDIQKCTAVIRYRLISNEISSIQMRGRVRQKGGIDVLVGSREEFEKEDINVERQYLMQEAIQLILEEDIMDIMEAISTKERNIFQIEDQERKRQKLNPNEKNKGQFYVVCKKCSNNSFIIVDGQFIRRIKKTHSIVCDKAIFSTIERRKTKKSIDFDAIKKTDKVFGFVCGHNWGSILIYQECEFVSLSKDYIQIIEKETQQPLSFKKWSDVDSQFPLDDITDDEMIKYRSQPTPPLPTAI